MIPIQYCRNSLDRTTNCINNICHVSNAKLLFPQDSSLISGFLGGKKCCLKKLKKLLVLTRKTFLFHTFFQVSLVKRFSFLVFRHPRSLEASRQFSDDVADDFSLLIKYFYDLDVGVWLNIFFSQNSLSSIE